MHQQVHCLIGLACRLLLIPISAREFINADPELDSRRPFLSVVKRLSFMDVFSKLLLESVSVQVRSAAMSVCVCWRSTPKGPLRGAFLGVTIDKRSKKNAKTDQVLTTKPWGNRICR